jgi:hypothetical protein
MTLYRLALVLILVGGTAQANEPAPLKSYTLTDLKQVVSNSPKCDALRGQLEQFTKHPVSLQFTKQGKEGEHSAQDASGQVTNHTHTTVKQTVNGNLVHTVGMGTFELNKEKIDYVLEVSANLDNPDHRYLYPIILASDSARCYFTALVKPSEETIAAFKQSIRSGAVKKGTNLHQP